MKKMWVRISKRQGVPTMKETLPDADIRVVGLSSEARFEWRGFDGADGFDDFRVVVTTSESRQLFEFGACVYYGLRKLCRFFTDPAQASAGLGFRHPDVRLCDVHRLNNGIQLII